MTEKMFKRIMHRQRDLIRPCKTIRVVQHKGRLVAEIMVQLPSAAKLQNKQNNTPPSEKSSIVDYHGFKAGIRQLIKPRS